MYEFCQTKPDVADYTSVYNLFGTAYKIKNIFSNVCSRNTGGFDMLGSGRDKIETKEQMEASKKVNAFHVELPLYVTDKARPQR